VWAAARGGSGTLAHAGKVVKPGPPAVRPVSPGGAGNPLGGEGPVVHFSWSDFLFSFALA